MTRLREVAGGILVATSRNDSLNSVVVEGQRGGALLVDPGWEQDELDALVAELHDRSLTPVAGFATHDPPRSRALASGLRRGSALGLARHRSHRAFAARRTRGGPRRGLRPRDPRPARQALAAAGTRPALGGPGGRRGAARRAHRRAFGRVAPRRQGADRGRHAHRHRVAAADDSPAALATYRAGLETLAPYAAAAVLVIPGHGSPTADGSARVEADRRYLDDLARGRDITMRGWAIPARPRCTRRISPCPELARPPSTGQGQRVGSPP